VGFERETLYTCEGQLGSGVVLFGVVNSDVDDALDLELGDLAISVYIATYFFFD